MLDASPFRVKAICCTRHASPHNATCSYTIPLVYPRINCHPPKNHLVSLDSHVRWLEKIKKKHPPKLILTKKIHLERVWIATTKIPFGKKTSKLPFWRFITLPKKGTFHQLSMGMFLAIDPMEPEPYVRLALHRSNLGMYYCRRPRDPNLSAWKDASICPP